MTEGRLAPEEVRTRTFTRVMRGYRRREVRRLLERAAADLTRLRNGLDTSGPDDERPLTPEQVEEVRFQPALGGYQMDEVDEFLDQLVVELERAGREPLRPPSALPAPAREGVFPAATPGLPPPGPARSGTSDTEVGPGRQPGPPAPEPGPAVRPGPPAPEPGPAARQRPPVAPPEPTPPPPAAGPLPAAQPPPAAAPRPAAGPLPAGPRAPAPSGRAPEPAPAAPDEGYFPPTPLPPSAAPAPPMPPPATQPPPPPSPARPMTPSEVETRTFDRGAPGYLAAHVDLFLAKAARALAGRDGETMTRWDVLRQRFPLGPRGYATNEVDAFLVRLATQFPDPDPAAQQEILRKLQEG
jgi:DivIVA domain-containing protein